MRNILDNNIKLSEEEMKVAMQILKEISDKGSFEKLNELKYSDFDEVPVDITTFLHDRKYLGNGLYDPEGRFTIFPYWENVLKDIFPDNTTTKYNTLILTGAIGLGKTLIAVICLLYMLYRLLCLKDPYLYYGLQPIDKISISFLNITIENAHGVAGDKFNQLLLSSPWFMSHGKMIGISNLEYVPDKHIETVFGSSNNSIIGRAIFCLDGDTVISTSQGDIKLKDALYKSVQVHTINNAGEKTLSDFCQVCPTIKTNQEYQIELEDGTVIKCTGNHRFMLKDGSYKEAKDLTEDDELW